MMEGLMSTANAKELFVLYLFDFFDELTVPHETTVVTQVHVFDLERTGTNMS